MINMFLTIVISLLIIGLCFILFNEAVETDADPTMMLFGSSVIVIIIILFISTIFSDGYKKYHETRDIPVTANSHNIEKVPVKSLDSNLVDKSKNQDSLQQALADNNLTETKIIASMRNGSDVVQTTNITVTAEDLNDSAIQVLTNALNKRLIAMRDEDKKTKPVNLKVKE